MTERSKLQTVFDSTINEGSLYDARRTLAMQTLAPDKYYIGQSAPAISWLNEATKAVRVYNRVFKANVALNWEELLDLAKALGQYYTKQAKE
jgi:hypothetical protein